MQKINHTFYFPLIAFFAVSVLMGCTAKRIGRNDVLLKKVIIKCDNPNISKDDIYGYLKQKPNRKLFGFNFPHLLKRGSIGKKHLLTSGAGYPFYLSIYNLVGPKREVKRKLRRDARYAKKYSRWEHRSDNKKDKAAPKKRRTIGEFLYDIGEPPVILDSTKTRRSVHQIGLYLDNKGYFNSTVRDTLVYPLTQKNRKKKAILCYIIEPATPYTIKKISWQIHDPGIAYDLLNDTAAENCLIKVGTIYDQDVFEAERERLTRSLRNNGYFEFSKDYIHFIADTSAGDHQVNVNIVINKKRIRTSDSTSYETNHRRFNVRNIYVLSLKDITQLHSDTTVVLYDTTVYREIYFLRNTEIEAGIPVEAKLKFKPEVLQPRISFRPSLIYRQSDYEATYKQLIALRVFRQIIIDQVKVDTTDQLDIFVKMFPVPKQSYTTQLEGTTNSGSSLGIGGSFGYENNNLFRGAEILQLSVKGGTEIQQTLEGSRPVNSNGLAFNTIQAGAEASLNIPREFFPFNYLVAKNRPEENRTTKDRRTVFIASYNYQRRLDYDRALGNLSYGYTFQYKQYSRVAFFPVELNVVKVKPRQGLIDLLQNPDPLLHYRFTDHFITDFRITYVYNSQEKKRSNVVFLKIDAETSGLLLRPLFEFSKAVPNADGSYEIAGIPFSHYLRFAFDFRDYKSIGDHQRLVNRVAIGIGLPLANFPTLPLEKSFYAGGANGIRAWEARTLGPGSYIIPADQKYAQFGDIQAEYNIEYRFRLSKTLNGAVFADGGNIWILKADPIRPNADFSFKNMRFLNDLAFGPGVGLRYDLSFFIIRLDWAFKFRDPSLPYGERWYVPGQRKLGSNFNFGIGYPF